MRFEGMVVLVEAAKRTTHVLSDIRRMLVAHLNTLTHDGCTIRVEELFAFRPSSSSTPTIGVPHSIGQSRLWPRHICSEGAVTDMPSQSADSCIDGIRAVP